MENASKALLIAASILIVILLIAFGMQTLNSAKGTQDGVKDTMDATEIATFNNKFTAYLGTNKSAKDAKALANAVISNNATNTTNKVSVKVLETNCNADDSDFNVQLTNAAANLERKI